jgi:hypothetical protein
MAIGGGPHLATYCCDETNPVIVAEAFSLDIQSNDQGQDCIDPRQQRGYPQDAGFIVVRNRGEAGSVQIVV